MRCGPPEFTRLARQDRSAIAAGRSVVEAGNLLDVGILPGDGAIAFGEGPGAASGQLAGLGGFALVQLQGGGRFRPVLFPPSGKGA